MLLFLSKSNKKKAHHTHHKYTIDYNIEIGLKLWSLIDINLVKNFTKLGLIKVEKRNRYFITVNEGYSTCELNSLMCKFMKVEMIK